MAITNEEERLFASKLEVSPKSNSLVTGSAIALYRAQGPSDARRKLRALLRGAEDWPEPAEGSFVPPGHVVHIDCSAEIGSLPQEGLLVCIELNGFVAASQREDCVMDALIEEIEEMSQASREIGKRASKRAAKELGQKYVPEDLSLPLEQRSHTVLPIYERPLSEEEMAKARARAVSEVVKGDEEASPWTEGDVRRVVANPLHTGIGPYERTVSDALYIEAARKLVEEVGIETFVALQLSALREAFPS